jgi:hypothetical protein
VGRILRSGNFLLIILMTGFYAFSQGPNDGTLKIGRTLGLIDAFYVDSVNLNILTEKAIIESYIHLTLIQHISPPKM